MVKESLYVITPVENFQAKYDEYLAKGFSNRGVVRYNLANTHVLVEESSEMFSPEDLALPSVLTFTHSEIQAYLKVNKDEWESPLPSEYQ